MEEELLHAGLAGALNQVVLNLQVLEEEIRRVGAVGDNAADPGRRDEDILGPLTGVELLYGAAVEQIQLGMGTANQAGVAAALQLPPQGASGQTAVASHVNPSVSGNFHAQGIDESPVIDKPGLAPRGALLAGSATLGAAHLLLPIRIRY